VVRPRKSSPLPHCLAAPQGNDVFRPKLLGIPTIEKKCLESIVQP
jgi:hypothetical protein